MCTAQAKAENTAITMLQKFKTRLNRNIEYMGSRECNRGLAMATSLYSVTNEYIRMHEKEWSQLIGMKERYIQMCVEMVMEEAK